VADYVWEIASGSAESLTLDVKDQNGDWITTYTGSESVSGVVWAGDDRASLFAPTVAWENPFVSATPKIVISVSAIQSAQSPGRYRLRLTVAGVIRDVGWIRITAAPGATAAPKVYCTFDEMRIYGGSWVDDLQTDADRVGFEEQRARARTLIDDQIISRATTGAFGSGGDYVSRRATVKGYLDADGLSQTSQLKEIAARYALALIAGGQVGADKAGVYAEQSAYQRWMAETMLRQFVALIDTDADGDIDIAVSLAPWIRLERG
jgi:hypothetical protein